MGSKLSRAVRPRAKAEASAVAPAYHDIEHANEPPTRQEPMPRISGLFSHDDIILKPSSVLPAALRRRNSAPAPTSPTAATIEKARELTAAFSLFHAEHCLMSIQLPDDEPEVAAVATAPSTPESPQPSNPSQEPDVYCITCCTLLPNKTEPSFRKEVVKPCGGCFSSYCSSCIRHMFVEACTDMTRMPPRCCVPLQLRYAKPHMTQKEIQVFKAKYEEWLTPSPFYCPVATCSAFIPERLLPERTETGGKRTDSGIGTPTSKTFACPTCEASICLDCRQIAHPCSLCNVSEFGIDEETTKLLKSWGYKQCPKCRHGLKRMHGCSHMECRCGAHFCYVCMGDPESCGRDCLEADSDDGDDDEDDDSRSLSGSDDADEPENQSTESEAPTTSGGTSHAQEENHNNETHETHGAPPAQAHNLDGGRSSYWASQPLYFGDEPGEDYADRYWNCHHDFVTYKIDFAEALSRDTLEATMECVKCWRTIYPEIRPPRAASSTQAKTISTGSKTTSAVAERVIGRHRSHGRRQGQYAALQSLSHADAIMGATLSRISATSSPLSQSVPDHEPSLMQNMDCSSDQVLDIYGNVVFSAEPKYQRRASMDDLHDISTLPSKGPMAKPSLLTASTLSAVFATPEPQIGFAYECFECYLLVCASCRDNLVTTQNKA